MYREFFGVEKIDDLDSLECEIERFRETNVTMSRLDELRGNIERVRTETVQKFQEQTGIELCSACSMIVDGSFDEYFNKDVLETLTYLSKLNIIECRFRELYAHFL